MQNGGLTKTVSFIEADYGNTGLPASSFDVVWALDSVCHTSDKKQFLTEAFRLLKTGGRIIISDGYLTKPFSEFSTDDKTIIKKFAMGFGSLKEISIQEFLALMEEAGFSEIKFKDATKETSPDFIRLYFLCRLLYPLLSVLAKLKLISRHIPLIARTGYLYQVGMINKKIGIYGIITAKK